MDNFDDYDGPSNYKGFDLTQVDEKDLSDVIERIDLIHQNLETIKELCKTLVSVYEPIQQNINKLKKVEPDVHQKIMEEAIKLYGNEKGKGFVEMLLGNLDENSLKLQIAKAKAFIISYERQFEDEETEPIQPTQFEESDVVKMMKRLTGGKNPLPSLSQLG